MSSHSWPWSSSHHQGEQSKASELFISTPPFQKRKKFPRLHALSHLEFWPEAGWTVRPPPGQAAKRLRQATLSLDNTPALLDLALSVSAIKVASAWCISYHRREEPHPSLVSWTSSETFGEVGGMVATVSATSRIQEKDFHLKRSCSCQCDSPGGRHCSRH